MVITAQSLLAFARSNSGLHWSTNSAGRRFSFVADDRKITIYPEETKSKKPRNVSLKIIEAFCDAYNELGSDQPGKYQKITFDASYLLSIVSKLRSQQNGALTVASDICPPVERVETWINRIVRDTKVARSVKAMHDYSCQLCGEAILLKNGDKYAEAHHIQPLGGTPPGPDSIGNLLCLCPNCHAKCDLGAIMLSASIITQADGHLIDDRFIKFHNELHGYTTPNVG